MSSADTLYSACFHMTFSHLLTVHATSSQLKKAIPKDGLSKQQTMEQKGG